ncbi:MAG: radical SAM protein [Planctomycetota bacterium]|nr:radical SAM protein [Planctomycetota bacterium]
MTATTLQRLRAYAGLGARALGTRMGSTRPFKITLMLTDRCDCRCQGCRIWEAPKGREMTPAEIGGFLAQAPSLRWVNLTGGEPFLRDDMVEVVAAVRGALPGLAVLDFPTTGQRTDAIFEAVRRMTTLGIPKLVVTCSLEGPPALHDEVRGREGAFVRMLETYAGLRAMEGVDVYLGMTLTATNAGSVEEALAAVRARVPEAGWRDVHFNVYTESGHYYRNVGGAMRAPTALDDVLARALRERSGSWHPTDIIESTYLRLLPEYLRTGRSPLPCKALRAGVFVNAQGDVHPCTVYGRRLGNVLEAPLYDILDGAEALAARDVVKRDACPGCWSPCEATPTIVATAPESLARRPRT